MTRVYSSGTAAVASDKRTVTISGGSLTALNCTVSSLIVIGGYFNFVNAMVDTTHLTLQIDHQGSVPVSGLQYAIYPLTSNEVASATANTRLATLLSQISVGQTGMQMVMDGSGITVIDPGAGKVRFNRPAPSQTGTRHGEGPKEKQQGNPQTQGGKAQERGRAGVVGSAP